MVQEIDIATGKVLFQWNSEDHVPFSQSEQPLPASPSTPWDWFHINAVKLDTSGNLLIDARDTWTTYEVSLHTGRIIWRLGGKDSSFKVEAAPGQQLDQAGEIFAWQHDPEPPRRRLVRRLGSAALLLGVRGVGPAAVQRRVPDRREHLPGVPAALAAVQPPVGAGGSAHRPALPICRSLPAPCDTGAGDSSPKCSRSVLPV